MREALTVIGFLIIVAFSALLAAPLFVDWNNWRDTIAQQIANATGASVLIEGPIEASILPQPWLSIGQVKIGEEGARTTLTIARAEADLSLAALFSGNVVLSNVILDQPRLELAPAPDGMLAPLNVAPAARQITVESYQIANGTVFYADPRAGDVLVEGINLIGDARSMAGPFKGEGGAMIAGRRLSTTISLGAAANGSAKLKLSVVPADLPLTIDLDGDLAITAEGPRFAGNASLARPMQTGRGDRIELEQPWRLSGTIAMTPAGAEAETLAFQIGSDESPIKFEGKGTMAFGEAPTVTATMAANQADLDRLGGVKTGERVAPLAVIERLRLAVPDLALPPVPVRLALTAEGVVLGGLALSGVAAELASTASGWRVETLEAALPGRTRLAFRGQVDSAGSGGLTGRIDIDARQASAFLAWLEGVNRTAAPNAAQRLALTGRVEADGAALSLSEMQMSIDEATASGSFAIRPTEDGAGRRLEARLDARRLDLDQFPSIAAMMPGGGVITEADVTLSAQSLLLGGIEAKSASGHVTLEGDSLAVQNVVVDDFGGASLSADGTVSGLRATPTGSITIRLDARDLSPVATALRRSFLPQRLLDAFERRAAAMSPAGTTIELSFGETRRLSIDGRFGGTVADATVELAGEGDEETVSASLRLDSLDAVRLARQLGFSPLPITVAGRAAFTLDLDGPVAASRRWTARYEGAGLSVEGTGKLVGSIEQPAIDGRLRIETADLASVAQIFAVPLPGVLPGEGLAIDSGFRAQGSRLALDDLTGVVLGTPVTGALTLEPSTPVTIGGRLALEAFDLDRLASLLTGTDLTQPGADGPWPQDAFGPPQGAIASGKLAITVDRLGLGPQLPVASAARGVVTFAPSAVNVDDFAATLARGEMSGNATFNLGASDAALIAKLRLRDVAVDTAPVTGRLDAALDIQGTGRTPAALLGALTGGGTFRLAGAALPKLAPTAFDSVVAAVDSAETPAGIDLAAILGGALDGAPLPLGDIDGSLALADGRLRIGSVQAASGGVGLRINGALDIAGFSSEAQLAFKPAAPSDGIGGTPPEFTVRYSGGAEGVERSIDTSALIGWATIRAAEREAKKLEVLEAEREAREKAAAEQKRLEAERMRLAIEAARQAEEERKAQEARQAEEARKAAEEAERQRQQSQPPPVPDAAAPVEEGGAQDRGTGDGGAATGSPSTDPFPDPLAEEVPPLPPLPPPVEIRRPPGSPLVLPQ